MVLHTTLVVAQTPGGPGTEDFPIEQTNDINESNVPAVPLGNDILNMILLLSFGTWVITKHKKIIKSTI
ncbi:MAG: hypothetical protein ACOVNR_04645 [Chitinophagaceae bacterium]